MSLPDPELDALLRDVALPEGFLPRLKGSFVLSEEEVDDALRQIAVPQVMLARLKEIPVDEWVDRSLRSLPVPFELVWRTRKPSFADRSRRLIEQAGRLALALALFVAIGLGLFSGTAALVSSIYPLPPAEAPSVFIVAYDGPLAMEAEQEEPAESFVTSTDHEPVPPETFLTAATGRSIFDFDPLETDDDDSQGPVAQWLLAQAAGMRPYEDVVRLRYGVMSFNSYAEDTPGELDSPRFPLAAGIEPPRSRGANRVFFLRHRTHPPIETGAGAEFASVAVPLTTRVQSYLDVQRIISHNRWPDPRQIRVEDFLAAVDYRFPAPEPGRLGIRTAGGPSVFGPEGAALLQVAVQAGSLQRPSSTGTHLVLAVDMSSSMERGNRVREVRQGICRLLDQLTPEDNVSLVIFQDEVVERIEKASAADKEEIKKLLLSIEPHGGTDLAAGLQQAMSLILADSLPQAKRLVLVTDSRVIMPAMTENRVRELLTLGASAGAKMQVLDVSDRAEVDPALARFAEILSGDVRRTPDGGTIYWRLLEMLSDRSPVIASEARLVVRFNPQCVAAYRLIGHDANALAAVNPPSLDAELKAGEAATALFEVWFKPGESDDVAQAEVTWKDPASGAPHQLVQRISRLQFAPSAAEMPICLQQAALAAETAEVLRGSRDALRELNLVPANSRGLSGVVAAGRTVHPHLAKRPDFQAFLEFVSRLERLEKSR